jgi:hypothetical protein
MMMDSMKIAKPMIDLQKNMAEYSFKTLNMVQEQTEKMSITFLDQLPWIPEEGKKAFNQWIKACRQSCDQCQAIVNENFISVEQLFGISEKTKP